jgi:hypothetical protein
VVSSCLGPPNMPSRRRGRTSTRRIVVTAGEAATFGRGLQDATAGSTTMRPREEGFITCLSHPFSGKTEVMRALD